ncbi:kinase phosphorylation protein-domain-containing protein [Kalaharituber pfeilii]|nr:kinase phosphorylation protein-domain-containing protein [Kalaharituber pfeilii]
MDLLSSRPLREGSRGGRSEFSWEAVKNDKDRENYLGHSLMAPVGRWQQGRDLTWYAKESQSKAQAVQEEEDRRKEELRIVKEAEQEALARALGLPVKVKPKEEEKPVSQEEIRRAVGNVGDDDDREGKGIGFGKPTGFESGLRGGGWEKVEGAVAKEGYEFGRDREQPQERQLLSPLHDGSSAPRSRNHREYLERDDKRDSRSSRRRGREWDGSREWEKDRERDRHRSRRDKSRSRSRVRHDDDRRRRHRDERSRSRSRTRRDDDRSRRDRERRRSRDREGNIDKGRDRDMDKQRDRGRDYGRRR